MEYIKSFFGGWVRAAMSDFDFADHEISSDGLNSEVIKENSTFTSQISL